MHIPTTTLHNGVKMPMIGLGVYKAKEGDEVKASKNSVRSWIPFD